MFRRIALITILMLAGRCAWAQTYGRYDYYLTSAQGQAISGATVNVYAQSACGAAYGGLASLYSTSSGTVLTQPLTTDGFGHTFFYTTPGCVTIIASSPQTGTLAPLIDQNVSLASSGSNVAGPAYAVQLANSSASGFAADANILINPTTHSLSAPIFNGAVTNGEVSIAPCANSPQPSWCSGADPGTWVNQAVTYLGGQSATGTILIPNGTFTTATTVTKPRAVVIRGQGVGTLWQYTGSGTAFQVVDNLGPDSYFDELGGFQQLHIHGPGMTSGVAIYYGCNLNSPSACTNYYGDSQFNRDVVINDFQTAIEFGTNAFLIHFQNLGVSAQNAVAIANDPNNSTNSGENIDFIGGKLSAYAVASNAWPLHFYSVSMDMVPYGVTSVQCTGSVAIVTAANFLTAGQVGTFAGLTGACASGLNGGPYTVLSAGLSSSQFEVTYGGGAGTNTQSGANFGLAAFYNTSLKCINCHFEALGGAGLLFDTTTGSSLLFQDGEIFYDQAGINVPEAVLSTSAAANSVVLVNPTLAAGGTATQIINANSSATTQNISVHALQGNGFGGATILQAGFNLTQTGVNVEANTNYTSSSTANYNQYVINNNLFLGQSGGSNAVYGSSNYLEFKPDGVSTVYLSTANGFQIGSLPVTTTGKATFTNLVSPGVNVVPPPSTPPTVATGAAGVLTATYVYNITFVTAAGEGAMNTAAVSATVSPSAQQVNLTAIPVSSDPTVTARNIYRSNSTWQGYPYLFQRVATISDNTTTSYSDNIADGSLGAYATWLPVGYGTMSTPLNASQITNGSGVFMAIGQNAFAMGYNSDPAGGYANTSFGNNVMSSCTSCLRNSGFGLFSLFTITTGQGDTGLGVHAGDGITTGSGDIAVGYASGQGIGAGASDVAMGQGSLGVGSSGSYDICIGTNTCAAQTGSNTVSIGYQAGQTVTSGGSDVNVGYEAGQHGGVANFDTNVGALAGGTGTTASSVTAIGYNANNADSTANGVTAVGASALALNTVANQTAVGNNALTNITTGASNVAVGFGAGQFITGGSTANQTSATSVYLGMSTQAKANGDTNEVAIGYQTTGNGTNTATLGNTSTVGTYLQGTIHSTGTTPAASAGTITGSNAAGYISGLSAATTVTITFANSGWTTWASCTANTSVTATQPYITAMSVTAVTFTFPSLTGTLYYTCGGN